MVRVVGSLRDYEGQRHVLIYEVELTVDFNTLTHHLLQIMLTHLKHTKGPIPVCSVLCALYSVLWPSPQPRPQGSAAAQAAFPSNEVGGSGGLNANMGMNSGAGIMQGMNYGSGMMHGMHGINGMNGMGMQGINGMNGMGMQGINGMNGMGMQGMNGMQGQGQGMNGMQGHGMQGMQGGGHRQAVPQANQATMALQKTVSSNVYRSHLCTEPLELTQPLCLLLSWPCSSSPVAFPVPLSEQIMKVYCEVSTEWTV
jgi:hypothetical protein